MLTFLAGVPVALVVGRLVVSGDAAATAINIVAHEPLVRLAFAANVVVLASYIAVTGLLYLLRPVKKSLSLISAFFSLLGVAIQAVSSAFYLAPLVVLEDAPYLRVFTEEQLHALALILFKLNAQVYNSGLVFFGFYCLLIGCLVYRSTFLPPILGVLMAMAGLGWLTFLSPPLAHSLSPYNLAVGIVGEGSLTLWLLVMGVNVQRWKDQARATREPE